MLKRAFSVWLLAAHYEILFQSSNTLVKLQFDYVLKTYVFLVFISELFDADSKSEVRFFDNQGNN